MPLTTCFQLALRTLGKNRLRSALTLLGVTMGVAVVITMVALGTGARVSIEQHVRAAGTNQITVVAGNYMRIADDFGSDVVESGGGSESSSGSDGGLSGLAGGSGLKSSIGQPIAAKADGDDWWPGKGISPRLPGRGAATTLGVDDAEAIAREVRGVRYRAPGVSETAIVRAGAQTLFARLQGTDAELPLIRVLTLRAGRFLTPNEIEAHRRVAVLSTSASHKLFGPLHGLHEPIGMTIETRGETFSVVGVVDRPGGFTVHADTSGGSSPDEIFVPYTSLQDVLHINHLHHLTVAIAVTGESSRVSQDIVRLLRTRHHQGPRDPDDFTVKPQARDAVVGKGLNPMLARAVMGSVVGLDKVTLEDMAQTLERSSRTMTLLLASVAGVSLLVGGIGVMNIMLVSVTERTREIGLRMAVGARGRDVLVQFLAEAIALSMTGGAIGIVLGIVASDSVGRFLRWATVISPASIVIAAGVAAAVGIFFGFYPARQASRLDPIDALRYE
jgi:putative ABC transport system permease protein